MTGTGDIYDSTGGNVRGDSALDSGTSHPHDVLCGRGGQSNNHPGNEWFRRLVRSNRALYRSCPKHTKLLVAKAIVQAVQQQDPPGRFIRLGESKVSTKDVWESITYTQAVNKTSQALREKESRDSNSNRNKKKEQQKQQQQQQQPEQQELLLQETDQKKNLEIAIEAAKRVKDKGVKTSESLANLTNVTIHSAGRLEKSASSKSKDQYQQSQLQSRKISSREQVHQQAKLLKAGDQQQDSTKKIPQHVGQKRKIPDSFVKQCWWPTGSPMNGMNAVSNTTSNVNSGSTSIASSGTIVTSSINTDFKNEDSSKRMKVQNGVGNADTNGTEGNEVNNMGRGVVNQVKKYASSTQTPKYPTPFPMETTLGSQQSTLSWLLNNKIFGRGTSVAPAPVIGVVDPSSATNTGSFDVGVNVDPTPLRDPLQSTSRHQQTASDMISNLQYQQEQRTSIPSFSSDQHMGKTSVQQLRPQHLQQQQQSLLASGFEIKNKVATSIGRSEEELEEIPTSGLMIMNGHHSTHGGDGAAPPPPPKGLKTQMSDWLTSFFPPSTKGDGSLDNCYRMNNNVFDLSSQNNFDEGVAFPPPPGGGAGLGRSVSSAIFDLVESPSLLLNSLRSGVTSLLGDSVFSPARVDALSSQIRRFPSTFQQQQMRQQQQQQNGLRQQFGGNVAAGGAMIGNHPVLGERAKRRASLLEDFEETPMEKELRNAKPEEQPRGPRSLLGNSSRNGSDYMSFA